MTDIPKPKDPKRSQARNRPAAVIEGEAMPVVNVALEDSHPLAQDPPAEPQKPPAEKVENGPTPVEPAVPKAQVAQQRLIPALLVGALGGLIAFGVSFLATSSRAPSTDIGENFSGRLSALEQKLQSLESKPTLPVVVDTKKLDSQIDDLKKALSALEARIAALATTNSARPSEASPELSQKILSLEQNLASLIPRSQLQSELDKLRAEITTRVSSAGSNDKAASLLLAVDVLKGALDRGDPYMSELEAARALGLGSNEADKLALYAERGVATIRQMNEAFAARISPILDSVSPKAEGVVDQLLQTAGRLVRLRPVGDVEGQDPSAIIARMEAKLGRSDLAGALKESESLPEPAQRAAEPVTVALKQRIAVEQVVRSVIADLVKSLARKG